MSSSESMPNCWEIRNCEMQKGGVKTDETGNVCPVSEQQMGHSCWIVADMYYKRRTIFSSIKKESCSMYVM